MSVTDLAGTFPHGEDLETCLSDTCSVKQFVLDVPCTEQLRGPRMTSRSIHMPRCSIITHVRIAYCSEVFEFRAADCAAVISNLHCGGGYAMSRSAAVLRSRVAAVVLDADRSSLRGEWRRRSRERLAASPVARLRAKSLCWQPVSFARRHHAVRCSGAARRARGAPARGSTATHFRLGRCSFVTRS
jgi:hypothetical protein